MPLPDTSSAIRDHVEVRDHDANSPIPHELHRISDVTHSLLARLAQLEDRLGPVRSPLDRILTEPGTDPVKPVSPIADTLREHVAQLEHIVVRIDQVLGDIEL